ncbi:hypothetical protein H6P81_004659 [Aristolochia fimbriata]|uniref:Ammonium transporter AmtB-like domain-containing protein n=1 Tax=Aristolochia fimbriata TaxID=158543 RepID=A0AAV7ESB2_ARIFI|nr:hypothetical protein H6P81_004659 [Aristolochia fimbriata]
MGSFHLPSNLAPSEASPEWMNKADNAWQMVAATLVGIQSVPGLVILYGSIVKKKWAVNSAFMALYAFAAVLVCWVGWGYQMSFGKNMVHFLGRPDVALDQKFLLDQAFAGLFPSATMVFFQFCFAAITLILIAGALLGRMNFHAWMLFVPLWLTFSYTIGAFSLWCPDGFLFKAGVMDYSGGYVIHLSSGVAGFTAAYWVGPRLNKDRERFPPNNILLMLAGAGLLWMGLVVPLRLSEEDMQVGDDAIHGEEAYALWGDGERFENSKHNSVFDVEELPSSTLMPKTGRGEVQMT